ncbi:hypothetical protein [Sphingomonas colocasiae]|uniref:Uncharacterized protein n=1 Tax=Sphingomonas colocasiae TaxID=1848973 RepID=A0ABS7PNK2_9SPHN|nr:hypothetical protein [Sphingomonas colocasiae]MBY8822813.1 hypothetical protein [Sphingomonas colocasiae]
MNSGKPIGYGHWIRQAEACRRTAARITGEFTRAYLLDLAMRCDALAAASVPRIRPKGGVVEGSSAAGGLMFAKPVRDPVSDMLIARRRFGPDARG